MLKVALVLCIVFALFLTIHAAMNCAINRMLSKTMKELSGQSVELAKLARRDFGSMVFWSILVVSDAIALAVLP